MRVLLALLLFACGYASAAEQTIAHGRFDSVRIELPAQRAEQFVLLLADGASEGARLAKALAAKGALVATIDTRALFGAFERDDAECVSPNGDLVVPPCTISVAGFQFRFASFVIFFHLDTKKPAAKSRMPVASRSLLATCLTWLQADRQITTG